MADRVAFNSDELETLWGLPWLPQLVYMRAIRPNMDYTSGVVGIRTSRTKRISYQAIREQVEVHETQGRTGSEQPSMSAMRNAIQTLIKVGLIARVSGHGDRSACLVFKCLLADVDRSVQNKYDRGTTGGTAEVQQEVQQEAEQGGNESKASNSNDLEEPKPVSEAGSTTDQAEEARQTKPEMCDIPPDTDLKEKDIYRPRVLEQVPVPDDFGIDENVRVRLLKAGLPVAFAESLLQEFINDKEGKGHTSTNWPATFVSYCMKAKRFSESFHERNPPRKGLHLVKGGGSSGDSAADVSNGFTTMEDYDDGEM